MKTLEKTPTIRHIPVLLMLGIILILVLSFRSENKRTLPETNNGKEDNAVSQQIKPADEVLAQERKWAAALVANDMKTVNSIMHRDFRLKRVYGDALPISKEMYLGMTGMSASKMDVTYFEILEELGDIVVAKVAMSMDWQQEGVGKLPPYAVLIDIWQKHKDGTWLVLSRVSHIIDEPYSERIKN